MELFLHNNNSSTFTKITNPQQKCKQSAKVVYNFLADLQLEFYFDLFRGFVGQARHRSTWLPNNIALCRKRD
jgi:hypothetical protein